MKTCRLLVSVIAGTIDGTMELCAGHKLTVTDETDQSGHVLCLTESGQEVAVEERFVGHAGKEDG